jgi:HK97 family phage portal protein
VKILGFDIRRATALIKKAPGSLSAVNDWRDGWRRIVEPFTGAWQQNIEESNDTLFQYPTLYACLMRIATDFGKLPFVLKEKSADGIWKDSAPSTAYDPVLRKPNGYQTAQQFREAWSLSKNIQGNAYLLKVRDSRGVVKELYVLDPCRVLPMVSESGQVFYRLQVDNLNKLPSGSNLTVPASEIIHDRCVTLHHWLIGVPPVSAAYWPALKNLKILKSAAQFFGNNAQPGGILTAPAGMNEDDAAAIKKYWDEQFTGANAGKVSVIGADMKFTSFAMKGADSQLVEQMRYSDEQICQAFGIPPFKIGIGALPAGMTVDGINQLYYSDALQAPIEHAESLLDEGLSISLPKGVEMDLDPLLRMDVGKQAEVETKLVGAKIKTPDEARSRFNLAPIAGGDTLWGQQQDFPLGPLSKRDPPDTKPAAPPAAPAPATVEPADPAAADETNKAIAALWKKSPETFAHV